MIKRTKQNWIVGSSVTIAGQRFTVKAAVIDADDFAPNSFVLASRSDSKLYRFFPHKGLEKGFERIVPARKEMPRAGKSRILDKPRELSSMQRHFAPFQVHRKYSFESNLAKLIEIAKV